LTPTRTQYLAILGNVGNRKPVAYAEFASPCPLRTTYFVQEDGMWQHGFCQEEYDLFMTELSYGEFVAAQ
jgi:hypothetical protein